MPVEVLFDIPPEIGKGIAAGIYRRLGGTVRDAQTGRIVALLREIAPKPDLLSSLTPTLSAVNLGVSAVNLGVSTLNLGVSVLNLGVSVVGFSIVIDRMSQLEKELQSTKEVLLKSNQELSRKIDLSFYANFAAALKMAQATFTMSDVENRKASAFQAINRFLEAEEVYYSCARELIEKGVRGSEQYLMTLALAYLAEFRCYLELGEVNSALHRLQESTIIFRFLTEEYVKMLLTKNSCVYLHSEIQDEMSLTRLTNIFRWLRQDESIDENSVFQEHRKKLFTLLREFDNWKESLPDAIRADIEFKGYPQTLGQLSKLMGKMESMIETCQRLESYSQEAQVMQKLGLSFQDWSQLPMPALSSADEPQVVCILVPEMAVA